jgi:hypothetical protein
MWILRLTQIGWSNNLRIEIYAETAIVFLLPRVPLGTAYLLTTQIVLPCVARGEVLVFVLFLLKIMMLSS